MDLDGRMETLRWLNQAHQDDIVWLTRALKDDALIIIKRTSERAFRERAMTHPDVRE